MSKGGLAEQGRMKVSLRLAEGKPCRRRRERGHPETDLLAGSRLTREHLTDAADLSANPF